MKRALITGVTGQDRSYLSEFLLEKGYEVHDIVRRVALEDPQHRLRRILDIKDSLHLHRASLESYPSLHHAVGVVAEVQPDDCYHVAAQSAEGPPHNALHPLRSLWSVRFAETERRRRDMEFFRWENAQCDAYSFSQ